MNIKKNVFNPRGIKLSNEHFYVGGAPLEIADEYQYLGIKLKPSGTFKFAVNELFDKASRAWFSISNVLYQHKKLAVRKALQLFDSLIRPIFLYAVELWLPFMIPKKGFNNFDNLMKSWETFQPELLNQKICRMLLSVNKKCSRLVFLGELGRYPVILAGLKQCLKYQYQIDKQENTTFVSKVMLDMRNNPQIDSWFSKVETIKSIINIPEFFGTPERIGHCIDKHLKGKFDRFFLDEINNIKLGDDGRDHNKLRLYKTIKGSFTQEPYISNVLSRNQRSWLSRYRTSSHNLRIESGRHTNPVKPLLLRVCRYCDSGDCDDEQHAILFCKTFMLKRQCFFARITTMYSAFPSLSDDDKLKTILCPPTTQMAKCVSKYLGIISNTRNEIDLGLSPELLQIYI